MTIKNNPTFNLTESETAELKDLWSEIRERVDERRDGYVWVRLCAPRARLTRKQVWMIASTLANLLDGRLIPSFVYGYMDNRVSEASSNE